MCIIIPLRPPDGLPNTNLGGHAVSPPKIGLKEKPLIFSVTWHKCSAGGDCNGLDVSR